MFDENIAELYKMFDDDAKPSLTEDEQKVVPERYFACFREGLVLWPNVRGVNGRNGRIELTKNVSHKEAPQFLCEVIELLQFPTWFSIDCFGFITDIERELVGFQWASKNSGLVLLNEKSKVLMKDNGVRKKLFDKFSNMTSEEFLTSWFNSHDRVSELYRSGKVK